MNIGDSLHDDLPAPHPDEPPRLRDDIADELNDHLACAMRRELLKDNDDKAATKRVLARFGNPARIARQLYLVAMKEQIMKDRITIGLMTAMVAMCAAMLLAVWTMMSRAERSQQALIAQLVSMKEQASTRVMPPEWGSLTIELTDHHGKPIAGERFYVGGKMYRADELLELNLTTDEQGRIVLDPIRAATQYTVWMRAPKTWGYVNNDLFLKPGEHRVLNLQSPPPPGSAAATFNNIVLPEDSSELALPLQCVFVPKRSHCRTDPIGACSRTITQWKLTATASHPR